MKPMIKRFIILGMLLIISCISFAQSASESYNKGLALMNKAQYTEAIACFRASMAINKSAANVKKCKTQITKCQRLQKRSAASAKPTVEVERSLNVDKTHMAFPSEGGELRAKVEVKPENSKWIPSLTDSLATWCNLSKTIDDTELIVQCEETNSTQQRATQIEINYASIKHIIDIVQQGKEVVLTTNPQKVSFKSKGGEKEIVIDCNSDTLYTHNWYEISGKRVNVANFSRYWVVENFPDWCAITVKNNSIIVKVNGFTKEDKKNYKKGRSGEIVLRSQDKTCTIEIEQTK